jgi:hypothetical protein
MAGNGELQQAQNQSVVAVCAFHPTLVCLFKTNTKRREKEKRMKPRNLVIAVTLAVLTMGAVSIQAQTCPPLTQGFWKTHQGAWNDGSGMTLGTVFYTNAQLESILQTPVRGDASVALAHQLIAAMLNVDGGTDPSAIQGTLADANNLLGSGTIPEGVSPSSGPGQQMENDESILDDFNSGDITNACAVQIS